MIDIRETDINELRELMEELFVKAEEIEIDTRNKNHQEYTIRPCDVGKKYREQKVRLMIVGQQANGWDKNCLASKEYGIWFKKRFETEDHFSWVIQESDGIQHNDTGRYCLSNKPFWLWTKSVFDEFAKKQYINREGERIWQDNIAYSNTYKIGYRSGGNIDKSGWEAEMQKALCSKIIQKEIEMLRPTHIIFETGDKEWLFEEIKKSLTKCEGYDFVLLKGEINRAKTIVTNHPGYANRCKLKDKHYKIGKATRKNIYTKECMEVFGEQTNTFS